MKDSKDYNKPFLDKETSIFGELDAEKAIIVFKKSLLWIILIILFTNLSAYFVIRYTKPVYESESELKLDVKSEASVFGLSSTNVQNLTNLSGEIELIKSRLFYEKIIDVVDLDVSYFSIGNVLDDERYIHSPFSVEYELRNDRWLDRKFNVEIINERQVKLTYFELGREISNVYNLGEQINHNDFSFEISLKQPFSQEITNSQYYFVINSRQSLTGYLKQNLKVEPLNPSANTIKISFTDNNPFKARDLVNAIDTLYLNYTKEEKNKANSQKIGFIDEQIKITEEQLSELENYFENFTLKNRTTNLNNDLVKTIEIINKLDIEKLSLIRNLGNLLELKASLNQEDEDTWLVIMLTSVPQILTNDLNQLSKLSEEKKLILASQNENTFAVRRKAEQISLVKERLKKTIDVLQQSLQEDIAAIDKRKSQLEVEFSRLPSKSNDYNKTRRRYNLDEEFYLSLIKNKAEYQIALAGITTDFKILASATLPTVPIYPQKIIVYGIGLISGFILSLLFVTTRYLVHDKVITTMQIERLTTVPILGSIPYYSQEKMTITKLFVDKQPRSAVSEALRSIRTNIEFMNVGKEKKVLSITSTIGGEGKTFVAVNLGGIIALSNAKVVILDLDMRKPRIHLAFSSEQYGKGVSTILINKNTLEECIQQSTIKGLDYIQAGPIPPNPSELLMSESFGGIINKLKELYDFIILDTPPIGLVTDGIIAMKQVDLPIYVLRANYSSLSFINSLNRIVEINKFKNISVILNFLKNTSSSYGYGYGYGYYDEESNKHSAKRFRFFG